MACYSSFEPCAYWYGGVMHAGTNTHTQTHTHKRCESSCWDDRRKSAGTDLESLHQKFTCSRQWDESTFELKNKRKHFKKMLFKMHRKILLTTPVDTEGFEIISPTLFKQTNTFLGEHFIHFIKEILFWLTSHHCVGKSHKLQIYMWAGVLNFLFYLWCSFILFILS